MHNGKRKRGVGLESSVLDSLLRGCDSKWYVFVWWIVRFFYLVGWVCQVSYSEV